MATVEERERLAVLETKVSSQGEVLDEVKVDVKAIKADVKALLIARAAEAGAWNLVVKAMPFLSLIVAIAAVVMRSQGGNH